MDRRVLILVCLLGLMHSLHLPSHKQQITLSSLQSRKAQLDSAISLISSNVAALTPAATATNNVFELSTALKNKVGGATVAAPGALSKAACQQATTQQTQSILQQVASTKATLATIAADLATLPRTADLDTISSGLANDNTYLDGVNKVLASNCTTQVFLANSVLQTNLLANRWITGPQPQLSILYTYFQRTKTAQNISNCPLATPYFDGAKCINVVAPKVFNMFTSTVQQCPVYTILDQATHSCAALPFQTNFTAGENVLYDNKTALPPINSTNPICPPTQPYSNGTVCVACPLPNYWSAAQSSCLACPTPTVYDVNLKKCVTVQPPSLTNLTSNWVTLNSTITNVVTQRAALLNSSNPPPICPSATPYYDGNKCITCPKQFSVDTLRCVTAPNDTVAFDPNLHTYLPIQTNVQTAINATNYTTTTPLKDNSSVPNCPTTTPYFDGIACIDCPDIATIFNADTKTCTNCLSNQIYNDTTHTCQNRTVVLVSSNVANLMATPTTNISTYTAQIANLTSNPNITVQNCTNPTDYSNGTNCFPCATYFNVETKTCANCTTGLDPITKICITKIQYLTNLPAASTIVVPKGTTINDLNTTQTNTPQPKQICANATPYAAANNTCIACAAPTLYFDVATLTCVAMPLGSTYNNVTDSFVSSSITVSNYTNATNYIESGNQTAANDLAAAAASGATNITKCNSTTPYFDGTVCTACTGQLFDIATKKCIPSCPNLTTYVNATHTCNPQVFLTSPNATNYVTTSNYTLANATNTTAYPNTTVIITCNSSTPYSTGTACINCTAPVPLFDLVSKKCVSCPLNTTYDSVLKKCAVGQSITNPNATNYIESANNTLANQIAASQFPPNTTLIPCPSTTPYYNGSVCIACPNALFDLATDACVPSCPNGTTYINSTHKCGTAVTITSPNATNYIATPNYTLANATNTSAYPANTTINVCNASTPFYNGTACINCTAPLLFDLLTKNCTLCPNNTIYNATLSQCTLLQTITNQTAATNYIASGNNTLANEVSPTSFPPNAVLTPCPAATPYYNDTNCTACTNAYFDLASNKCVPSCPNLTTYVNATHTCNPYVLITSPNATNYIATPNYTLANATNTTAYPNTTVIITCNSSAPFSTGTTCINCTAPQYFDLVSKQCTPCPTPTVYNPTLLKCATPQSITNQNATNYIEVSNFTMANEVSPANFPPNSTLIPCPLTTPYYTTGGCIACSTPTPYFNLSSNLCVACPNGSIYTPHQCVTQPIVNPTTNTYSNLNANNWLTNTSTNSLAVKQNVDLLSEQNGTVECPLLQPFYNKLIQACVSCPANTYYNFNTNKCVSCAAPNYFNAMTMVCQPTAIAPYQTSLASPNLVYNGQSQAQYADTYAANIANNPATKDCPPATPYFNGVTCIACVSPTSYFNMYYLVCENCPAPSIYSGNQCVPQTNFITTSPDVAKMYSTIF